MGVAGCEAPGAEERVQGRYGLMAPSSACCLDHSVGLQRWGRMERRKGAVVSCSIHKARPKAANDHHPQKQPGWGPRAVSLQEILSRPWTHMSWCLDNGRLYWLWVCGYKRVNESRLVFKIKSPSHPPKSHLEIYCIIITKRFPWPPLQIAPWVWLMLSAPMHLLWSCLAVLEHTFFFFPPVLQTDHQCSQC